MRPYELLDYSLDDYPFPGLVAIALGEDHLTDLHADLPRRTWQTDQQSPWHASFYRSFDYWEWLYQEFIREVIAPRFDEACYFQRVPTFRVQLPGNTAVGEFHTDAQYNHPLGEVSFWLPLTLLARTSTLWIENDDHELVPVEAEPGKVAQFSAVTRRHGNFINDTDWSRVSFDFRLIPKRLLPKKSGPGTKHTGLRFIPGEYYDREIVGG